MQICHQCPCQCSNTRLDSPQHACIITHVSDVLHHHPCVRCAATFSKPIVSCEQTNQTSALFAGSPQPTPGDGLVAAINTPGISNTDQCGVCYSVSCMDGPTRGLPGSEFADSGCISSKSITVMITDSCPCDHDNPDNQKWCCGDRTHLDLSHTAFGLIANHSKGVVDIKYTRLESCNAIEHGIDTQTCDKLQQYSAVFQMADLCRAAWGASVSMLTAGIVLVYLAVGLWQKIASPSRNNQQQHLSEC